MIMRDSYLQNNEKKVLQVGQSADECCSASRDLLVEASIPGFGFGFGFGDSMGHFGCNISKRWTCAMSCDEE